MAKLGTFGAAVREFDPDGERDEFEFFGQTFEVRGVIPPMLMLQLGAAIAGKIGDMEGNAAMWQALRCALSTPEQQDGDKTTPSDESQFDRFYLLAVNKRCDIDTLISLVWSLVGAQGGKATAPLPTSPDGQPITSTSSSSSASDSPDSHRLRPVDEVLGG
jgi:hypothetical protein